MLKKTFALVLIAGLIAAPAFAQRRERRERQERAERVPVNYGSNIIRLAPISVMDIGVGFGLSYEKIFGKEQMVGLVLPVSLMLDDTGYDPGNSGNSGNTHYNTYFYFNPGLKIYPFGQRKVTYAVGPSLLLGYGGGKEWRFDGTYYEEVEKTKLRLGMMVNNYVNFQITPSFNLGMELGLGVRYYDRTTYDMLQGDITYHEEINVTGQFSMTLGYRF
jgi:hypothetical protein